MNSPPPPLPHTGDHRSSSAAEERAINTGLPPLSSNQSFSAHEALIETLLETLFVHLPLSSPSSTTTAAAPFSPLPTHNLLPKGRRLGKRLRQFLEYLDRKRQEREEHRRNQPSPPPSGEAPPPPSEDAPLLTPPPPPQPTPAAHPLLSLTHKVLAGAVGVGLGLGLGLYLLGRFMSERKRKQQQRERQGLAMILPPPPPPPPPSIAHRPFAANPPF